MQEVSRQHWETSDLYPLRSLVWDRGDLVDLVCGGTRFHPDGTITRTRGSFEYSTTANRAVLSPTGTYAVIYTDRSTSGLVLKNGEVLRQINRSYYHAHHSDFPVAFGMLPDGREVLAHCPEQYGNVQIEEIESGQRLTESRQEQGRMSPEFVCELSFTPDGRYLLTVGWIWQPEGRMAVYEVRATSATELALVPGPTTELPVNTEVSSAALDGNDRVLVATPLGAEIYYEDAGPESLGLGELGSWSLATGRWESRAALSDHAGILMPMDEYVIDFFDHPKLVVRETGEVVHRWTDLRTGRHFTYSSVEPSPEARTPPLALDPVNWRFAVADGSGITAISLG